MHERRKKGINVCLIAIVLTAVMFPAIATLGSFWIPSASGTQTSRKNLTNTQHNWSGGDGAPTSWSPTTCEAGSCTVYFNFTVIDKNKALKEGYAEGGMNPVNHSLWIHLNDTSNSSFIRNWTGDAGPTSNGVFTVTRAEITTYGKINVSYSFAIPAYFVTGRHYVNFNVTDNATTFVSSEIWSFDTYILITGEGITAELLDGAGADENIDAGRWGNETVDPGDTNVEWNENYIRVKNSGSYDNQQVMFNFVGNSWDSVKVGDSITIDTNIEWAWCATNYSADNPDNSFVSEGSTWSGWLSDTTGSYEFRFWAVNEYLWVKIRVLAIPSPLGGADDFEATFTTTASGLA